jgi:arylsulfatase A-like enzyme
MLAAVTATAGRQGGPSEARDTSPSGGAGGVPRGAQTGGTQPGADPSSRDRPSPRSTGRALGTALIAGALGGAAAATLDWARAGAALGRFLPDGTGRLLGFLIALYGAAFSVAAVGLVAVALIVLHTTPLGASAGPPSAPPLRRWAAAVAALVAAVALGGLLYQPARFALHMFHHPGLTALWVGAAASGLGLLTAFAGLLLASVLSRRNGPLRAGAEPALRSGPLGLYAVGWTLGFVLLGAGVAWVLRLLLGNPRMTPDLRALNVSLWAPLVLLLALALGHGIGSSLAALVGLPSELLPDERPAPLRRFVDSAWAALFLPLGVLALLGGVGTALYWPTLRLLDLRPLVAIGSGSLVALALLVLALCSRRLALRTRRVWLLAALPLVLWATAVGLGRIDRVRKAALAQVPLALRLVQGAAAAFDLDRDGAAARWTIGGSDCNDLDPEIHPGAFDWPDNSIDENCNDHDAHAAATPTAATRPPLPQALPARPNVVLITVDALRADHTSLHGYFRATTPQLSRLLDDPDAVLFENAFAHAPSTRYSVPAILTGRYPSTIAWGSPFAHWPPEVLPANRLLSEALKARGYATAALLSYHYFEPSWGLARGFDDYDIHLMTLHSMGGDPAATSGSSARELADLALGKLPALLADDAGAGKPFFLWAHFYDPHFRYERHAPPPGQPDFGSDEAALYDGEIRYTDEHIGRLLEALRGSPSWSRTLVVVTADHGEGLGEHGIPPDRRHGYHLYANQTKVPLLLRVPGLRRAAPSAPRRILAPAGHVDVMPTILELSGEPPELGRELLGRSLVPLLLGSAPEPARPDPVVFQEVMYEGPTVRKALVTPRWHLIENLIPDGTTELYDLAADPGEEHDVQGTSPLEERALRARLAAWIDDSAVPRDFNTRVAGNYGPQPLAASTPLNARIGDALELVGVDVPRPEVQRGQAAELALVLHARRRIPSGFRLFFHLRGQAGGFVNLDHDLVEGLVPPQRLRPGDYVRDRMRINIPPSFPAGPATLLVGLYKKAERAPVSGPAGVALPTERAVQIATLQVR